ncbi:MAG: hypothetical protein KatS3mg113_0563 [Planctomycetaceae bacterium]|nr:MAG: hypothetical protein KatS3mg113_0563 [Planctomycetaceae bacterium]
MMLDSLHAWCKLREQMQTAWQSGQSASQTSCSVLLIGPAQETRTLMTASLLAEACLYGRESLLVLADAESVQHTHRELQRTVRRLLMQDWLHPYILDSISWRDWWSAQHPGPHLFCSSHEQLLQLHPTLAEVHRQGQPLGWEILAVHQPICWDNDELTEVLIHIWESMQRQDIPLFLQVACLQQDIHRLQARLQDRELTTTFHHVVVEPSVA